MAPTNSGPITSVDSSSMPDHLSSVVQGVYQGIILDNWVFDNFISFNELFAEVLQRTATCPFFNGKLHGKLVSSVPIITDDNLKNTPVTFWLQTLIYVARNLITWLFHFDTQLFCINTKIRYHIKLIKHVYSTFTVPCKKSEIVSSTSLVVKNIVVLPTCSRFPVKLICVDFGLASNTCCLSQSVLMYG